ncbi:MAG: VOC family protein [Bacillota bacterium]|nr:VOC family protein [Bacillota bacterium]
MTFINTIVFVKDIEKSKKFYTEVMGLKITEDFGTIVFFENHFVIHIAKSIVKTVFGKIKLKSRLLQGRHNLLVYFETDDLQAAYEKVSGSGCKIIHQIKKQEWGQNVFRFYDPDRHIIEIGEPLHVNFSN